jgi:N-acetylmuramoyl-L-alanine amidase
MHGMGARILAVLAVVALALATAPTAVGKLAATAARIGHHGVETRFVIDLSAAVDFQVFRLTNPYRIAIDFPEVDWRLDDVNDGPEPGLIGSIRYGLLRPGTSRVVLDLRGPYRIKDTFLLPPSSGFPYRLVLDLIPIDKTTFEGMAAVDTEVAAAVEPVPLPLPKPRREEPKIIVIDPGHGGADPGTIGRSGTQEKNIVLTVARELRDALDSLGNYRVVLTRNDDTFLKLRDRVQVARQAGGDLFISLHADSHSYRATQGVSVYTLSEKASDAEAAALAEKENKSDIIAGFDLSDENAEVTNILIDLAQRETMNRSANFANVLVQELASRVTLLRRTHRFAGFAVLKAPDIPSVLVELGYLSNSKEEDLLKTKRHRAKVIEAVIDAIETYFAEQQKLARS